MAFEDLRIRQMDAALAPGKKLLERPPPPGGWLRAVRESLGMSVRQLARRANLSVNAVASVERNEAKRSARLESLARLAHAMDCELVYAIVPRDSLKRIMETRATQLAGELVGRVASSMELEAQGTGLEERRRLVRDLARSLQERPAELWNDPPRP